MNKKDMTTLSVKKVTRAELEKFKLIKQEPMDNVIQRLMAVAGSAKGENRSFKDTEKTAIDGITQVEAQ